MLTRRRAITALLVVVVAVVAWFGWLLWQVQGDLRDAEHAADRLQAAVEDHDDAARDRAVADLVDASGSAHDRTDGPSFSVLGHLPWVGDDARGIERLSTSLDLISRDGIQPLVDSVDDLDRLTADGRIDLDVVDRLQAPVTQAADAFAEADHLVGDLDSSGYSGSFRPQFDRYVERIEDARSVLASAATATEVLPDMVGANGPRDYLLVFQNNAEIRATGGMPGSWARIHADDGAISIEQQGSVGDVGGERSEPILPLSDAERAVYGDQLGTYFQDAGFTPDFPRAAELLSARWEEKYPTKLDGVLALDPVALSYLLEGTGPVTVGDLTLTPDNVVDELLNKPYLDLDPTAQNQLFRKAAKAIFDAATGDLAAPVDFVRGLNRAAEEGRFLVAPFEQADADALGDSRVLGVLPDSDGEHPHVEIGVNDATGSKMSYYLRYWADVAAVSCADGRQKLSGSMSFNQKIDPEQAAALPESVTGTGDYGVERGTQLLLVRIYGPVDGSISKVSIDGKMIGKDLDLVQLDGRPVAILAVFVSSREDVVINWSMETGDGQSGSGTLGMTPSIVPGSNDASFKSAC